MFWIFANLRCVVLSLTTQSCNAFKILKLGSEYLGVCSIYISQDKLIIEIFYGGIAYKINVPGQMLITCLWCLA